MATGACAEERAEWREDAERMVRRQLEARGIADERVLGAMRQVPRHQFVPPRRRASAWEDRALPIGHGQTISQPYVVARMTELLQVRADDTVLEIGTGSGYQAAVLSVLAKRVHSIEIVPELAAESRARLAELGFANVEVVTGDGYLGLQAHAPFPRILVTAAPDHVPQPLLDQLAVGGRMVIPVGAWDQEIRVIERSEDGFEETRDLPVRFVPLVREPGS
jgi:protein-L-isoaspartate(D-aspartate) O-methyltransferase